MRHANSRSSRAARLASHAGSFCENLEPRQLLSAFVYSDLADLIKAPGPDVLGDGYNGPIAVIGDIDGDNYADILAGSSGIYTTIRTLGYRSGAAVFSGATGALIRQHVGPSDGQAEFGWAVAALGDVDEDGIPDYAIGANVYGDLGKTAAIYSGATGEVLRLLQPETEISRTTALRLAGAGDLDGDGKGDLLMATGFSVIAYSAATGAEIHRFDLADYPGYGAIGAAIAAGTDIDGDGTPDYVFTSTLITPTGPTTYDITATRVVAISGATGQQVFTFDVPFVKGDDQELLARFAPDMNGDDTPDLLLIRGSGATEVVPGVAQRHELFLYSGVDASLIRTISDPDAYSISDAVFVSDIDDDGVPDIAAGVPLFSPGAGPRGGTASDGAIYLYSGATGERISIVIDSSGATTINPFGPNPDRMALGVSLAAADLDGDGAVDLVSGTLWSPAYAGPGQSRVVTLDGNYLFQHPVFDGTSIDSSGNLIAWGRLGHRTFVFFKGRTTFLTDLPGFSAEDRIIRFEAGSFGYFAIAAPNGDQSRAFSWHTGSDLKNPEIFRLADVAVTGAPAGEYTFQRIVDSDGEQAILQYQRDDGTPAAFRFSVVTERLGVRIPVVAYLFDGTAVAMTSRFTLGTSAADPTIGILATNFIVEEIEGFTPSDVREALNAQARVTAEVVGLAQRDGDLAPRPYLYRQDTQAFTAIPLIEGGTEWMPKGLSFDGSVYGTYRTADGRQSAFHYVVRPGGLPPLTVDVSASEIIGGPQGWADLDVSVLGVYTTHIGEFFIQYTDPDSGDLVSAQLSDAAWAGPALVAGDSDLAVNQDGSVIVTTNAIGGLIVFFRDPQQDNRWTRYTVNESFFKTDQAYTTPHFGDIITWSVQGQEFNPNGHPYIALSTETALILLEPTYEAVGGKNPRYEFRYVARNLTLEIPGATAIIDSLLTIVPSNGLRLLGGLNGDGDVVLYGLTQRQDRAPDGFFQPSQWAYGNLTDQVLRAQGLPVPTFNPDQDGDLIGYATGWDGLNITGVYDGQVVSFWTAPSINGWRYANITYSVPGEQSGFQSFKNLSVYLTPWGGINITGNDTLQVYWWTPSLTDWRFEVLSRTANGPTLRSDTITTYVSSWGGLNIAGLDDLDRLWVYWWSPAATSWTAENLDLSLSEADRQIPRTGRLAATVSAQGEFSIFARTPFGHMLRYNWSPTHPWAVENLSLN